MNKCFRSREGEVVTKTGDRKTIILVRRDFRPIISNQLMLQVVAVHPVYFISEMQFVRVVSRRIDGLG